MSRFILILLILSLSSLSMAKSKKAPKLFKSSSIKLSHSYVKKHPHSQLLAQINPSKDHKSSHQIIKNQCKKQQVQCYTAFDAEVTNLININISGTPLKISKFLTWLKENSDSFIEKSHKN